MRTRETERMEKELKSVKTTNGLCVFFAGSGSRSTLTTRRDALTLVMRWSANNATSSVVPKAIGLNVEERVWKVRADLVSLPPHAQRFTRPTTTLCKGSEASLAMLTATRLAAEMESLIPRPTLVEATAQRKPRSMTALSAVTQLLLIEAPGWRDRRVTSHCRPLHVSRRLKGTSRRWHRPRTRAINSNGALPRGIGFRPSTAL